MINSIGQQSLAGLEAAKLRDAGKARATGGVTDSVSTTSAEPASSSVARMAAEGAPVDLERVGAIKAAIASGNYPVDPDAIAAKMLALDLPVAD